MKWEGGSVTATKWRIFLKLERTLRKAGSHRKGENSKMWNQKRIDTTNQGTAFDTRWTILSFSSISPWSQRDSSWEFSLYSHIRGSLLLAILALESGSSCNNLMKGQNYQAGRWEGRKVSICWNFKGCSPKTWCLVKWKQSCVQLGGLDAWVGVSPRCGDGVHRTKQVWVGRRRQRRRIAKTCHVIYTKSTLGIFQANSETWRRTSTSHLENIWKNLEGAGNEAMVYWVRAKRSRPRHWAGLESSVVIVIVSRISRISRLSEGAR